MESIRSLGFHVIPVAFDDSVAVPHSMFIKRHSVTSSDNSNTLFVVNVPYYCNKEGLCNIFRNCGPIISIHICEHPGPFDKTQDEVSIILNYIKNVSHKFKVAYITFKNSDSIDIALQMNTDAVQFMSTEDNPLLTGIDKWMKEYVDRYPDKSLVQIEADEYMRKYDEKEKNEKEDLNDAQQTDEDGWVTIPVKKKALTKKERKGIKINKKAEKKKRIEKELQNFYLFQQREVKRDKIAMLRQQFEEDKRRIAQMQQQRRFKPFS